MASHLAGFSLTTMDRFLRFIAGVALAIGYGVLALIVANVVASSLPDLWAVCLVVVILGWIAISVVAFRKDQPRRSLPYSSPPLVASRCSMRKRSRQPRSRASPCCPEHVVLSLSSRAVPGAMPSRLNRTSRRLTASARPLGIYRTRTVSCKHPQRQRLLSPP